MHVLEAFLELFFYQDLRPETPRGWLILSSIFGLLLTCVLGYTLLDSPSKADTSVVIAFLGAPLGLLYASLHYVREPRDRRLCALTLATNAVAVIFAIVLWA